jgi:hypothetical protein
MALDPRHAVVAEVRKTDDGADEDKQQGDFMVHGSSPSLYCNAVTTRCVARSIPRVNNTQTRDADASGPALTFGRFDFGGGCGLIEA